MDFRKEISGLEKSLIQWRREFHQIPEIAMEEEKTASAIAEKLRGWGLTVHTGVGRTGVVGILQGRQPGKTLGIRADMDALPVTEETGLPFTSTHPGRMHACGHDGHITIALGTAKLLSHFRDQLKGTAVFLFQPAEETLNGAQAMLSSEILKRVRLDAVVGLHIWPDLPLGKIAVRGGPVMAAVDRFSVKILGKGGHGAIPQKSVDPIVIASEVVLALQRIVSREIDPLKPAVLTVGRIQGGTTFNVIPDWVELEGTVRTFDPDVRSLVAQRIEEMLKGITSGSRATYNLNYEFGIPAVQNDGKLASWIQGVLRKSLGEDSVVVDLPPSMGGEDFALFQGKAPGVYMFLGTNSEENPLYPIHHAKYSIDERVLPIGVKIFCEIATEFLA
ncbi:MAG: amidohydrolase [Spirochaetes bacterium]|nr:amidohydrolase [Spirochaetota bacterium]